VQVLGFSIVDSGVRACGATGANQGVTCKRHHAAKARQQHDIAKRCRVAPPLICLSGARSGGGYGVQDLIAAKILQMARMVRDRISTLGVPSIRRRRHDGWDDGGNGGARCWPTPMRGDITLMEKAASSMRRTMPTRIA